MDITKEKAIQMIMESPPGTIINHHSFSISTDGECRALIELTYQLKPGEDLSKAVPSWCRHTKEHMGW